EERPAESIQGTVDGGDVREGPLPGITCRASHAIVRVRGEAEPHHSRIVLVAGADEASEARRAPDDERQHAAGHGVERTGMTDVTLAEQPPDPGHDIVRGGT